MPNDIILSRAEVIKELAKYTHSTVYHTLLTKSTKTLRALLAYHQTLCDTNQ